MSGIYFGRTAQLLLVPAVLVFGLFMFGVGFLSGSFYRARSPVETIIRRQAGAGSTLANLQSQGAAQEEQPGGEAESLAQATGSLETSAPGESPDQVDQADRSESAEQEPSGQEEELDTGARDRALAELRANQEQPPAPEEATEQPSESPPPQTGQPFTFQVGAFLVEANAAELAATLISRGYEAWMAAEKDPEGRLWHFVRVGRYQDKQEATSAAAAFRQREGVNAVPVPLTTSPQAQATSTTPATPQQPVYIVYAGVYSNAQAARNAARPLLDQGYVPCVATILDEQHQTWHLVEVVEFPTREEAELFMQQNAQRGGGPELKIRELDARAISGKHCF